MVQSIRDSRFM